MTLLASERSLLIRNKFRSVLQLRIQNRRQQTELSSENGVRTSGVSVAGERERSNGDRETEKGGEEPPAVDPPRPGEPPSLALCSEKGPPAALAPLAPPVWPGGRVPQKKARLAQDLREAVLGPAGPLELLQKHLLPLEPVSFPQSSEGFDDDITSSSSSPEQLGGQPSPGFPPSPGRPGDPSLSDLSPGPSPSTGVSSPSGCQCSLALLPATESGCQPGAAPDSMATPRRAAAPLLPKAAAPLPARPPRPRRPPEAKPKMRKLKYHQYIPPDQRGEGGAPAAPPPADPAYSRLLQQQQVFLQLQILNQQQQPPPPAVAHCSASQQVVRFATAPPTAGPLKPGPAPGDPGPAHKLELLPPNLDDLTVSELRQQLRKRGLPVSGTKPSLLERLKPFQVPRASLPPAPALDLAPLGFLAAPPAPPAPAGPTEAPAAWRPEPQGWQRVEEELSVEAEMQKRMRMWHRERKREREAGGRDVSGAEESCETALHPFLQQETGSQGAGPEGDGQADVFSKQVLCVQPCEAIGQDFELPLEITVSPAQVPPTGRTLEEELQEAIQRVQMAPSQSIDDILDTPLSCTDSLSSVSELQAAAPAPVLPEPLCPSLSLELPASPPPVPPAAPSRKRSREPGGLDPADWLEALTSGLRPATPPTAPFLESDFGLDSELSVSRVLDLMVEQW